VVTIKEPSRWPIQPGRRPRPVFVSDVLYVILTLIAFALLALLTGFLDRRLSQDGTDR